MKSPVESVTNWIADILARPLASAIAAAAAGLAGFYFAVCFPFTPDFQGTGPQLSITDPSVFAGQEVYHQEGCQYCHSQNLRPISWEVNRFVNLEKYGNFPLPEIVEYSHESPSMRGSFRIGPDLSRLAGKYTEEELARLLKNAESDSMLTASHQFGYLFEPDQTVSGRAMSWKIRAMMNAGNAFSDPFQRGFFDRLENRTRGDLLVLYLASRGKVSMQFAGKYYAQQ